MIIYFKELKQRLRPPTLWCVWSMLRKTLKPRDNVDLTHFVNLKSFIKNNAKGYRPKKAFALRWGQIVRFMTEAPDIKYLASKVNIFIAIFC